MISKVSLEGWAVSTKEKLFLSIGRVSRNICGLFILRELKNMRNARGLRELLVKLGLKIPLVLEKRHFLLGLEMNIDKSNTMKELKGYEQEIKSRKTKQRS